MVQLKLIAIGVLCAVVVTSYWVAQITTGPTKEEAEMIENASMQMLESAIEKPK